MSDIGETRCSCCGVFLEPGTEYYCQDKDGNDITISPMCCGCAV